MANELLTPQTLINAAVADLQHEIVLPSLFNRSFETDFRGGAGDTISIERPSQLTHAARTYTDRSQAIVLDEVVQSSWTMTLGPQIYSAVPLTDEDLSRDLRSFADQILRPQVRKVSEAIEDLCIAQVEGVTNTMDAKDASNDDTQDAAAVDIVKTLVALKIKMDRALVSSSNRRVVISPDLQGLFLNHSLLLKANESGDGGQKLRDASLGRLMAFDVFVVDALADNTMVGFVPEAFHLVTKAPVATQSMVRVASASYNGIAMRHLQDYDAAFLRDRSILSTYAVAGTYSDPIYSATGEVTGTEVVRAVRVDLSDTE